MKVLLAGYNLDAEIINEFKQQNPERKDITPETLSAAYARISRDPRPIDELRQAARVEIEKSRKSNEVIIFGLGHSSVAEHATFNFDIINVSRLAMETIQKSRLCSYTEKSQRYITLTKDYLLPEELKGTEYEKPFLEMIRKQNNLYEKLFNKLKDYIYQTKPELAADPKNKSLLEGWAKEDARYITSLATYSQTGLTLNARNLEKMLRRLSASNLAECRLIGEQMYNLVKDIAPSIVKYPKANEFELNTYPELKKSAIQITASNTPVKLIDITPNPDNKALASLLYAVSSTDYANCLAKVSEMNSAQKQELFNTAVQNMKFYDQMLREFEMVELTYELTVSAACFGQLKRHRIASITPQDYNPDLGIIIPKNIVAVGLQSEFTETTQASAKLYEEIKKEFPEVATYILTNAHQRKVLFKTNLREMYHISRLREDAHAQWDIQNITRLMSAEAAKVLPICGKFLGGKDQFETLKQVLVH